VVRLLLLSDTIGFFGKALKLHLLVITSDMELYPKHTPFKYSFVFNAQEGSFDGGDKIAQREFQYGEELLGVSLPVPQSPVAKYEFDGWFSEDGKTRYSDGDEPVYPVLNSQGYPIGENGGEVKLIAVYKVKQYTVTLDFADDETMPVTLTVEHGSSLSGFLKYEKDNGSAYLKGWSVDRYGSFPVPDKVTEDLYLYAVWQEYKNITFVYSDTKSEVFKIDVTSGKTSKLPETAELPGYDFEGWYSSELCIGKPITEVYYGNIQDKYYAKWSAAEYTINFVTSNGDVLEDIVYTYGDTDVLPTLTRYGYDFGGWRVNENNGSGFYNIPAKMYGDKTLYAVWLPKQIKVTLDPNGGTLSSTNAELKYESEYSLKIPTREGYDFKGWYIDGKQYTDEKGSSLEAWQSLSGATFTAQWSRKQYTVTFKDSNGAVISSQTVYHGERITFWKPEERADKLFLGWVKDNVACPESMIVKSNITVVASWRVSTAISTVQGLKNIAKAPAKNYHLVNDINLDGANWTPIESFSGILDGCGYAIKNFTLTMNSHSENYGFIRVNNGTVENITLKDFYCSVFVSTTTDYNFGCIVGTNNGVINNCVVNSNTFVIKLEYLTASNGGEYSIGGVVGLNNSKVTKCKSDIDVSGSIKASSGASSVGISPLYNIAAMVGINSKGDVILCEGDFCAEVTFDVTKPSGREMISYLSMSGLCGRNYGNIEKCRSVVDITVTSSQSNGGEWAGAYPFLGGIAGHTYGNIKQCYSEGKIVSNGFSWSSFAGGLVARAEETSVLSDSYSYVYISNNANGVSGGIVGENNGEIKNCYSVGDVTGKPRDGQGGGFGINRGKIQHCFSVGNVTASATAANAFVYANRGSIFNCYYLTSMKLTINGIVKSPTNVVGVNSVSESTLESADFYFDTLYWDPKIWEIEDGELPKLKWIWAMEQ